MFCENMAYSFTIGVILFELSTWSGFLERILDLCGSKILSKAKKSTL